MATYRLECDHCGWSVTTAGPGRVVHGRVTARLYCATCGAVRECATRVAPARGPLGVPLGPRHGLAGRLARGFARHLRGDEAALAAVRCPVCQGADLLLAPRGGTGPLCPCCGAGRLHARPTD